MNGVLILRKWKEERNIRMQPNPPMPRWERLLGYILWTPKDWEFYFFYFSDCWEAKSFKFILNNCPSHGRIGKEVALCMWRVFFPSQEHCSIGFQLWNPTKLHKKKAPKKGREKKQGAKTKKVQANKQPKRGGSQGGKGTPKYRNLHQSLEAYQLKKREVNLIKQSVFKSVFILPPAY